MRRKEHHDPKVKPPADDRDGATGDGRHRDKKILGITYNRRPTRREFCITTGACLAAGGALAYPILLGGRKLNPWGNPDGKIQQAQINEIYEGIYNKIKEDKGIAEKEGKPLFISITEHHRNTDSLLVQLMVLDIAQKLEIRDFFLEGDKPDVDEVMGIAKRTAETNTGKLQRIMQDMAGIFPDKQDSALEWSRRLAAMALCRDIEEDKLVKSVSDMVIDEHHKTIENVFYSALVLFLGGGGVFPADPRTEQQNHPLRDRDMARTVTQLRKHKIMVNGGNHLPALMQALQSEGFRVCAFDARNEDFVKPWIPGIQESAEAQETVDDTITKTAALEALNVPRIVIDGEMPTPAEAWAAALRASLAHDLKNGKVTRPQHQAVGDKISMLSRQLQGSSPSRGM